MASRDARRRVISLGLLLAFLLPLAGAAGAVPPGAPGETYVAQGAFGVKHAIGLDRSWLFLRPPWETDPTGEGVRVAVIDTGVDPAHPDLEGRIAHWRDFAGDATGLPHAAPYDDHGHGTHVAGILAGQGHLVASPMSAYFPLGLHGVAPDVELWVAKAIGEDGTGRDGDVARAIEWAVDPNGDGDPEDGVHVINLSIGISSSGGQGMGSATREAVEMAIRNGVVVIVASGNDGGAHVAEPGDVPEVVTVGAADRNGNVAAFSNGGEHLDLVAPGVLVSAYPRALDRVDLFDDGYVGMGGTSMAAPVVAGVVALMMDANPHLMQKDGAHTATRIERILKDTAVPLAGAPAERQGAGMLDAYGALQAVDAGGGDLSVPGAAGLGAGAAVLLLSARGVARRVARAREPSGDADFDVVEFDVARGGSSSHGKPLGRKSPWDG